MEQNRDHHNAQIWNAVDAKNYKQAIKLIDKRLSKGPDEYLEALKFHIRGKLRQFSDRSTILLHLEELRSRKPPISDLDATDLYSEVLDEILPDCLESWARIIGELKWECVKLSPKNEALCLKALEACLFKDDLHHARQIVNSIEKNFPKNHNYVFWNVCILFLYSDQKKLPLRSIQTPQEILLLNRLVRAYGKPEQTIEYLEDPHLGPDSSLAKGEWDLWITKLKLYKQLNMWQKLFETTIALLKRARTKNSSGQFPEARMGDWLVWESLIESAVQLRDYLYFSKVRVEIEAQLDPESGIDKSWRRNASLAWVKFCFESSIPFSASNESEKDSTLSIKIIAVVKYLEEYGNASTAYSDLRPYVEKLEPRERTDLLNILTGNTIHLKANDNDEIAALIEGLGISDLSTASLITQAVNKLKLRYLITCCISRQEYSIFSSSDGKQSNPLLELAEELMKSYQTAIKDDGRITKNLLTTDRHPADDMAVLASMCLIKLGLHSKRSLTDDGTSRFLQATALLEFALKHSQSNFQIILLLIRLYSYLGCGSLAMKHYHRLLLKQIQLDTLSYTIFDRISTLHPHPFDHLSSGFTKKYFPIEHLQKQQKFYQRTKDQISRNIWLAFQHGSYNSVFEMIEVSERLRCSMSAASCVIESRKISRFLSPTIKLGLLPLQYQNTSPNKITNLLDNNDYKSFPSFESLRGPTFHELCTFFPLQTSNRLWSSLLHEQFIYILSSPADTTQDEHKVALRWLRNYASSHTKGVDIDKTGMTSSEALAYQIHHTLALMARDLCNCEEHYPENFEQILKSYFSDIHESISKQHELVSKVDVLVPASQDTLHVLYTAQEIGKTLLNFCSFMGRLMGLTDGLLGENETENAAISLMSEVTQKSALIKNNMNESGWIDRVLDKISDKVREAVDENFMEEWAGLVVESWRESTVGLSYLKCIKT
ncbi:hypothetical protein K3495_g2373 [Podosphaera aphanis]|nr:hypothetical protein K3495_g2373 [Podosphaera aphanis]